MVYIPLFSLGVLRGATVSFMDHSSAILDSKSQNSLLDSNQVTSKECRNGSLEQISRFSVFPHRPSRVTLATTVMKGIDRSIKWHRPLEMASTVYDPEICSASPISLLKHMYRKKGRCLQDGKVLELGKSFLTLL